MFTYVRYIAIVCVVAGSIISALLARVFVGEAKSQIFKSLFSEHITIAETVASGLWRKYAPLSPQIVQTPSGPVTVPVNAAAFPLDARRYLNQYDVSRIVMYTFKDNQLYKLATNSDDTWKEVDGAPLSLVQLNRVMQGFPVTRVVKAIAPSGNKVTIFQSLIPVPRATSDGERVRTCLTQHNAQCVPEIFIESISDASDAVGKVLEYQWLLIGTSVILFLIVGGVVLTTVARTENIISKQHEVNLELTAAAASAEAQSRDKSMFLANISHELRTPLNAIIGFSEIIKHEAQSTLIKQHQEYIEDIHASGKHLLALINDVLDYSKAEAGKLQIEYSEADMLKLTRNCLRMVMPRAEEAQVMLVENLPKTPLAITTDVKKLKQVLLNLFSNAVKFTPAGGEVKVSVWEDIVTKDMVVEVRDTGIGIAPKDISRVMMPFVQVDSTLARRFEGTGLGLPLSKKLIESMNGQFYIESEINKGTTITFRLPIQAAYGAPSAETAETAESA